MDLLDDETPEGAPKSNAHEFTVSEISGAVKRVIEDQFGRVRVRGEIGRVSRPSSGHMYFDLKDDRSVVAAISWKGQVSKMQIRPEEGMEVIATGKMTTFPGQSKYQMIVETIEPAGAGALMAMLEARRKALAAEGLFAPERKRPIPYLPKVIGVVTSPSGAVIRDILHRLRDRFPRHVVIWPVAVQGQACAGEVARAIRGFNALPFDGPIARPDLLIVARGGGSLEDLWGFNEEIVVRAAAESEIPLISAVGHETDTTLIDFASDKRAPTPTAAAEMAVPVRADLIAWLREGEARMQRSTRARMEMRAQRLTDLARGLGRPEALTAQARQRFDASADRLGPALLGFTQRKRTRFGPVAALIRPQLLNNFLRDERKKLAGLTDRVTSALTRNRVDALRKIEADRAKLTGLTDRLRAAPQMRLNALGDRLDGLDRMRQTLGYTETLRRGYAVVRAGATGADGLVTTAQTASATASLQIEFADGRLSVAPENGQGGQQSLPPAQDTPPKPKSAPRAGKKKAPEQGSLF
ncbi:exodeoxyribonuclease VII large subunit [Albirhodobacter sp. R86504]|uniref:exodeoxyribonuclease VII large subunit n=1 Tax=Albirhodobacter sp. R86504 TaxID=3093848 RepID=UPI00366E1E12